MSRYFQSSYSRSGTTTRPTDCEGRTTTYNSGGATSYLGRRKSPIVKSDGVKPTDYSCCWIERNKGGMGTSEQNGILCPIEGTFPQAYKYLRIKSKIPFYLETANIDVPGFAAMSIGLQAPNQPAVRFTYEGLNAVADNAILGKIKDEKFALGVAIGEAKETANLLLDLTEDLASMVDFVRHGRKNPIGFAKWLLADKKGRDLINGRPHWKSYEKAYLSHPHLKGGYKNRRFSKRELTILGVTTQAAANRWMQYRYGMIPTYNDMLKLFDIAIEQVSVEPIISSRVTIPFPKDIKIKSPIGAYAVHSEEVVGRHQIKVWYKVKKPVTRSRAQWGIHFLDIPSILYELTPFSWMLDWLYPIGSTLEVLSATRGLTFLQGYRSQYCSVKVKADYTPYPTTGVATANADSAEFIYGAFHRQSLGSFPLPSMPSFQNPFGYHTGQRIVDVLSLIRQSINFK